MLKTKLCVILKQTQPRITVNQNVSTMCIEVGGKKHTQKNNNTKDNPKTVSLKILEIFLK